MADIARADFNLIMFNEHLGDNAGDINTDFPFKGASSSIKSFRIEGEPTDDAFLLMNHTQVNSLGHKVLVNGQELPDLPVKDADDKSVTQMASIPPGRLQKGNNTLQFKLSGSDNFIIFYVVVNWREKTSHD